MALGSVASDRTALPAAELQVLAGISAAHLVSHVYMLALPVLLPVLKQRLGVGYLELGLALTAFNVVSGLTQAPIGFLVDRLGARRLLLAGLCLGGVAFFLLATAVNYPMLIVAGIVLGLANCVYHPADYAILNSTIADTRIGRAFSFHTFAGFTGSALAPIIILGLAGPFGLSPALYVVGLLGPLVAASLLFLPAPEPTVAHKKAAAAAPPARELLTPTVLSLTLFFAVLGLSGSAISNFGVVALMADKGISLASANAALTANLAAAAFGVLAGGYLADCTRRHGDLAALGFGISAMIVLAVALFNLPPLLIAIALGLSGFLSGMIMPSRDMLVRRAAPPGAAGSVFGLVSTGFNIGGIVGPLLFGWVMDHAPPFWIFGLAVLFMLATALYGYVAERWVPPPAPRTA